MFRKFAAAMVAVVITVGAVFAEEIKGTFVKYADGKLTVKVDGKDKEFKCPADLKVGKKGTAGDAFGKAKEGAELVLDVEKDEVKSVKMSKKK